MYDYEYLRAERLKRGLQIKEVAEKVDMDESNLSKLERGLYVNIPLHLLSGFKKVLNIDLNKFIK